MSLLFCLCRKGPDKEEMTKLMRHRYSDSIKYLSEDLQTIQDIVQENKRRFSLTFCQYIAK